MSEWEQTNPETVKRKRSRLGCGLAMLLCLICYVLSYPWVVYGLLHLPSPAAETLGSAVSVLYSPVELAGRVSKTFDRAFDWYIDLLHEIFPGYFDDGLLWRVEPGPTPPGSTP